MNRTQTLHLKLTLITEIQNAFIMSAEGVLRMKILKTGKKAHKKFTSQKMV